MKPKPSQSQVQPPPSTAVQRGETAAKAMARALRAEHKHWKLPLLTWKDGKVVSKMP